MKNLILAAQGISKCFQSGEKQIDVLTQVDFELEEGEVLSIRGESGSGKSTLLNLLSGIERPDAGQIFWEGEDLAGISEKEITKRRGLYLGFIFQAFYLLPELNVLDNTALAGRIAGLSQREAKKRARDLLERIGLGDRGSSQIEHLSGGERQRVAIARAMINQPKVLLADEPTGNLDEKTAARVIDLLFNLSREKGLSLVLVTHHPGFAEMADRQIYLQEGTLLRKDPLQEQNL